MPFIPVLLLCNVDPAWEQCEREEVLHHAHELETGLRACGHPVKVVFVCDSNLRQCLEGFSPWDYVVLNVCEGLPGVDHSEHLVAQELAAMGFTFTGADAEALALSWDKPRVKRLLRAHGVPTPDFCLFRSIPYDGWQTFPAIVKPAYEHCSLGLTREAVALNARELRSRIRHVLDTFHQPALVEDFIDGREFHVSIWGAKELHLLPPAEMDFAAFTDIHDRLCTYDSKFVPGSAAYEGIGLRLPAPLSPEEMAQVRRVSFDAYQAVRCRDYARLDIRLRDGIFYVLDVNPNADLSSSASMAYAAEMTGYPFGAMASRLVAFAACRHPRFGAMARAAATVFNDPAGSAALAAK